MSPGEVFRQAFHGVQWPSTAARKVTFSKWYATHCPERTSARGKRWYDQHKLAKLIDTLLRRLNQGGNVRPQLLWGYGVLYDKQLGR